jgi:hypothetical protein
MENVQTFKPANLQPVIWPLKAILAVLFLGPLAAPLFQASGVGPIADTGALARDMLARFICPTPAKSYYMLGFPMGVCARCWGATIGLWAAWLLFRHVAHHFRAAWAWLDWYLAQPWLARLGVSALPFWLWVAEIRWWPAAPYWILLINGALAGAWAGLFFCSAWPGLVRLRPYNT